MPPARMVGNMVLSLATRVTSGYRHVFDSQCGYTAITRRALGVDRSRPRVSPLRLPQRSARAAARRGCAWSTCRCDRSTVPGWKSGIALAHRRLSGRVRVVALVGRARRAPSGACLLERAGLRADARRRRHHLVPARRRHAAGALRRRARGLAARRRARGRGDRCRRRRCASAHRGALDAPGLFYARRRPRGASRRDAWPAAAALFAARLRRASCARRASRWDAVVAHWLAPGAMAAALVASTPLRSRSPTPATCTSWRDSE